MKMVMRRKMMGCGRKVCERRAWLLGFLLLVFVDDIHIQVEMVVGLRGRRKERKVEERQQVGMAAGGGQWS